MALLSCAPHFLFLSIPMYVYDCTFLSTGERRLAEAWAEGGKNAEKKERTLISEEKDAKHKAQLDFFQKMVDDARAEREREEAEKEKEKEKDDEENDELNESDKSIDAVVPSDADDAEHEGEGEEEEEEEDDDMPDLDSVLPSPEQEVADNNNENENEKENNDDTNDKNKKDIDLVDGNSDEMKVGEKETNMEEIVAQTERLNVVSANALDDLDELD
jgi:hypothetical protein